MSHSQPRPSFPRKQESIGHSPDSRLCGNDVRRLRRRALPRAVLFALGATAAVPLLAQSTVEEIVITGIRDTRTSKGATGLELDIHNTPQAVVQLDRSMLDTFAFDSVNSALKYANGVSVESVETERTNFFVRGFDIRQMQLDGALMVTGEDYTGQFDTAIYDKIEVIRGANGLLTGIGAPSGTVNYIRKRPLNDTRAYAEFTGDRWGARRFDIDYSTPLTADGSWAARFVAANSDEDTWIDRYNNRRQVAYAVVDGQLTDNAVLTFGYSHQNSDTSNPLWGALPTVYSNGVQTDWDPSSSNSMNWAWWDTETQNAFAELLYRLPNDWQLKLTLNHTERTEDSETIWYDGRTDPVTGEGLTGWPGSYPGESDVLFADLSFSGDIDLFGREHALFFGASDNREETQHWSRTVPAADPIWGPAPPFFGSWNGSEIPRPDFLPPEQQSDFESDLVRYYAAAQWRLTDALALITGVHRFDVEKDGIAWTAPVDEGEAKTSPYVGAVWSVTEALNVYASYSDIFRPQNELDINQEFLGASQGKNYEIGAKQALFGNRLLASVALYRAEQTNLAEWAGEDIAAGIAWYRGISVETQGIELDLSGRINDWWTVQAGYAYLDLKNAENGDQRTYLPEHSITMLTEVSVPQVPGLSLAGSLRWQDEVFYISQNVGTRVTQPDYVVLGLSANYDVTQRFSVALNVDNVTDEKYLNSLYWADIYAWDQAYYGEPRNYTLRLNYRW